MNKIEFHPLSVILGAIGAALLLFACSGGGSASTPTPPSPPTSVTSQVAFYQQFAVSNPNPGGGFNPWLGLANLGAASADTVITDISWSSTMGKGRLLVDGTPVYGWGFGGASSSGYALPSRISLEHGIRVPAGATLAIETGTFNSGSSSNPENFSLAGYTL